MLLLFFSLASFRFVPEDKVGVVVKNAFGASLAPGQIIATRGEKGPQARILPPGWHPWLWPVIYDVEYHDVLDIKKGEVGIITAVDGKALPAGEIYRRVVAGPVLRHARRAALPSAGAGFKGPQASVLTPGQYRINPKLFEVKTMPVTNVPPANVAVLKSNIGERPEGALGVAVRLVDDTQRGIRKAP